MRNRVFVIAEAGVNHDGELARAADLVYLAAAAGADAVKFQTFRAEEMVTAAAPKADYQRGDLRSGCHDETQLDMLRRLQLTEDDHRDLIYHAKEWGIEFMSTPFDLGSLRLLTRDLGLRRLKIGSGDLTNAPMLIEAGETGLPVILSTGMATLDEVRMALKTLVRSIPLSIRTPDHILLHCTSAYPAPVAEVNLRAMDTMADAFGLPVGLSDHSEGIAIAIAAVARGAVVIEKHLTQDRNLQGPDHRASLEPDEFAQMVTSIRQVELALGDGIKQPGPAECKNMTAARKSIVAACSIAAGETFTTDNLTVKRPGGGLPPTDVSFRGLLGRPAPRVFAPDDMVET